MIGAAYVPKKNQQQQTFKMMREIAKVDKGLELIYTMSGGN
jgi:hypothetical protein